MYRLLATEEMEASEVDWETINANLPYEHNEESHAQRRYICINVFLHICMFVYIQLYTYTTCLLNTLKRAMPNAVGIFLGR